MQQLLSLNVGAESTPFLPCVTCTPSSPNESSLYTPQHDIDESCCHKGHFETEVSNLATYGSRVPRLSHARDDKSDRRKPSCNRCSTKSQTCSTTTTATKAADQYPMTPTKFSRLTKKLFAALMETGITIAVMRIAKRARGT
ncbi:hypothetical protein BST61_g11428 [Cercospora zeina]